MKDNNNDYSGYFHCDKTVREDSSLTDISKLAFGDIAYFYFLRTGKCTATNHFFAGKYGKSNSTISNAITKLVQKGYILRYLDEYKNRTIFVNRKAFAKDNGDLEDLSSGVDIPPDNDPQLPAGDAPITSENQKELEKKFPNISKLDSDEAAS